MYVCTSIESSLVKHEIISEKKEVILAIFFLEWCSSKIVEEISAKIVIRVNIIKYNKVYYFL